jgi:chromosome segregation protein
LHKLKNDFENKQNKVHELKQEIEKVNRDKAMLNENIEGLKRSLHDNTNLLMEAGNKQNILSMKIESVEKEKTTVIDKNRDLKEKHSNLTAEFDAMKLRWNEASKTVSEQNIVIIGCKADIEHLKQELYEMDQMLNAKEKGLMEHDQELQDMFDEKTQISERLELSEINLTNIKCEVISLKNEKIELESNVDMSKSEATYTQEMLDGEMQNLAKKRYQIGVMEDEIGVMHEELTQEKSKNESLKTLQERQRREKENLQSEFDEMRKSTMEARTKAVNAEKQVSDLKKAIDGYKKDLNELRSKQAVSSSLVGGLLGSGHGHRPVRKSMGGFGQPFNLSHGGIHSEHNFEAHQHSKHSADHIGMGQ